MREKKNLVAASRRRRLPRICTLRREGLGWEEVQPDPAQGSTGQWEPLRPARPACPLSRPERWVRGYVARGNNMLRGSHWRCQSGSKLEPRDPAAHVVPVKVHSRAALSSMSSLPAVMSNWQSRCCTATCSCG